MELVYVDADKAAKDTELSDAAFWDAYLVDDDSEVAPLVLEQSDDEKPDVE